MNQAPPPPPTYTHRNKRKVKSIGMGSSILPHIVIINLPLSLRRKEYNQCILPQLTYSSDSWRLTYDQGCRCGGQI